MSDVMRYDQQLGYVPAIPLPFYYRGWRSLWRWQPMCIQCNLRFKSDSEWESHYVLTHIGPTLG